MKVELGDEPKKKKKENLPDDPPHVTVTVRSTEVENIAIFGSVIFNLFASVPFE